MPTPKRKVSRSRRDMRSASKGLHAQSFYLCSQGGCEEPKLPHEVCNACGFYRGRKVMVTKNDRTVKRTQAQVVKRAKQPTTPAEGEQQS